MKKVKIPACAGMTICCFLLLGFSPNLTFSQDSTIQKTVPIISRTDTTYKPLTFILSNTKYSYINQVNPDTVTRKRFLWYPMKNTEDIFNFLPGYYLKYMDVGQLNPVSYNQLDQYNTGVLRNGRPINDLMDGSVDYNLFSRNEISEIELSNGFGNNVYGYHNTVNVIQRQIFQNRPYTEISFIQDRYENLYFDGNFHANILRSVNFNFGITKQSYDGKYVNSDFDKWIGRFNLNFAASNKLNFFAYVNYATIQKGLNEGINADTVDISNKDILFDPDRALVRNSDSYEKKERFDIDAGAVLLSGKNSFTKLQLFVSNSFREYRDEENRLNPNGIFRKDNYHWINYGAKLQQVFNFKAGKQFEVVSKSEVEYNYRILQENSSQVTLTTGNDKQNILGFLENITVRDNAFYLGGYLRGSTSNISNGIGITGGVNGGYEIRIDSLRKVNFEVYVNNGGLMGVNGKYYSKDINFAAGYYMYKANTATEEKLFKGVNSSLYVRLWRFDLEGTYAHNITRNTLTSQYPVHSGNLSLSFHDVAFKNKLEYKIGVTSKFWSEYNAGIFSGRTNSFSYVYLDPNVLLYYPYDLKIPQNATLDFYIMGKIGKATFGITLENILNRVIYNAGVYPNIDRGGLANVVSRFNLTWNFFD
jgi:hypothetical protein